MNRFNWSWIEMCGPGGLVPWYPSKHDVGICFQQIFLQVPVLILFAITSAYYYGNRSERTNYRQQKWAIRFRFMFSMLIAIIPAARTIVGIEFTYGVFRPVYYLTSGVEIIAWFVHSGYVLSLRHESNYHGPVVVRVLWTLTVVLSVINLRTYTLSNQSAHNLVSQLLYGFALSVVVLQVLYGFTFISCTRRTQSNLTLFDRHTQFTERSHLLSSFYQGFREDLDPEYLGVAMEEATLTSKLIFHWVNPLMKKGNENKLKTCDDLYDLPTKLNSSYLCIKLHSALTSSKRPDSNQSYGSVEEVTVTVPGKVSLLKALHRCFSLQFYSIGILKLLADLLGFGGPMLLNQLVTFIEDKEESMNRGYLCAAGLFLTTLLSAFLNVHFNFLMAQVGLQLRGSLISTIYRKALNLSYSSINKFSIGEIVNFMSTDTDRIVNSCPSFHSFWSIPVQLVVTFYLLYMQVGIAFLAGVAFTVILIPINKLIASKIGQLSTKLMEKKDQRVATMTELLRGIRVLKVHVWEERFLEKVFNVRQYELKYLKGRKYLDALCVYFWATTPVVISILTFATYSLMGNQLTAATVFTSMALLNMLIAPLNAFPWVLNGLTEAWVSLRRIQKFLDLEDSNLKDYFGSIPVDKKEVFSFQDASFHWGENTHEGLDASRENNKFVKPETPKPFVKMDPKDMRGRKLVKSSFHDDDRSVASGSSRLNDKIFSLRNLSLSITEGMLVGVIGPVGSGKSTFLASLLGEIEKKGGIINMRNIEGGCALVTQNAWVQKGTIRDNILFGKSFDSAWYKTVLEACCLNHDIEVLNGGDLAKVGEGGMTLSGGQRARVALARAVYQDKDIYLLDDVLSAVDVHVARHIYSKVICGILKNKTRIMCTNQVQLLTSVDLIIQLDQGVVSKIGKPAEILSDVDEFSTFDESLQSSKEMESNKEENGNAIVPDDEETSETGAVGFNVYLRYWTSIGNFLAFLILLSMIFMQSSRNVTDYWLSYWVSQDPGTSNATNKMLYSGLIEQRTTQYYLIVYALLAVVNTFFTLYRAFIFAYGGVHAAEKIHDKLLTKVIYSKVTFFDISPIGRILNRFSSDTYTIDDSLPFILNILLAQFFGLIGSLVITIYGLPWLCLLIAPLVPVYHYLQNTYRHSSRELKRLSSVSLSPIYSHFNETLQGLTTIRAFRCLSRFKRINEDYLECNQKAQFTSQAATQWLALRLQLIGVIVVTGVGVIAVLQHQFDVVDPALVGLTVSYALSITALLNGVVSAFTETEKELISLERVGQYIDEIEPEVETGNNPPYAWPSQGVIIFQSVYLKYREHLAPSLNGVSFETRPAEKIGVVGRTGAGKSSLIVALLRLVHVSSGNILIDTVNINYIGLQGLRSRIAVIPQDPFLFEGTIRENVDPLEEYRDPEIWSALEKCHIKNFIERLGGLDSKVSSGGRNFSQGQRQLICLVRAVLRNAKIVCVDEATASVDSETDKQIQQTIRSCFRQSTVLTIAHRISTIMDCDRVLVLGDGEVIEFDAPETLAVDKNSVFYQLCQQEI